MRPRSQLIVPAAAVSDNPFGFFLVDRGDPEDHLGGEVASAVEATVATSEEDRLQCAGESCSVAEGACSGKSSLGGFVP